MRKLLLLMLTFVLLCAFGCKQKDTEKEFMELITQSTTYKLEGVMETNYMEETKQSSFCVLYNSPDEIKIVLTPVNGKDSQIIIKNKEGVYVLVPAINKNFKIKSDWPSNGSYPYLLQSLTKDIANTENPVVTEDENTKTIETDTRFYKDAVANKQKIILDKKTNLPKEIQILDKQGNIYIRVVFTKIELDSKIDEKEFVVNDSMTTMRSKIEDEEIYGKREIKYPSYCPEGSKLEKEHTEASKDGKNVISIMTYTGTNDFTIVQEYINDRETMALSYETGYIIHVLGQPTILKENAIVTLYEGIEYTVASNNLPLEEMVKILSSYMIAKEEK